MQDMIYISEQEYQEMKEQIIKLWGIIHLQRQEVMDLKETNSFQALVLEKYKKLAGECIAREARRKGEIVA